MANEVAKTAPGGTHETQTTYAKEVVALARLECNIYNDFREDGVKNDATGLVKIPTRNAEVKVSSYDVKAGIELTQSATEYIDMPMDSIMASTNSSTDTKLRLFLMIWSRNALKVLANLWAGNTKRMLSQF